MMKDLNWDQFTQRVREQFNFQGCFFLNRSQSTWIGDEVSGAFSGFLDQLFKSQDQNYFRQVHFYKLRDDDRQIVHFLALIPLRIPQLEFEFMGVVYKSPDHLLELMKKMILPHYLVNMIRERLDQHKFRLLKEQDKSELLQELEEKKSYADALEMKVSKLKGEIDQIRAAKVNDHQKVKDMGALLEKQNEEYRLMADSYQELFETYQNLEREYVQSTVDFENKITKLKRQAELGEAAANAQASPPLQDEIKKLRKQLSSLRKEAETYKEQVQALQKSGGAISPQLISELRQQIVAERKKAESYRLQMVQLEMKSKYKRGKQQSPSPEAGK